MRELEEKRRGGECQKSVESLGIKFLYSAFEIATGQPRRICMNFEQKTCL